MDDSSPPDTIDRIDRALSRIEAALRARPTPAPAGLAEAYARLDERHDILRVRVQETIEQLDALVDDRGRG